MERRRRRERKVFNCMSVDVLSDGDGFGVGVCKCFTMVSYMRQGDRMGDLTVIYIVNRSISYLFSSAKVGS